ncbi:MAG: efflux RND transporter permease subunit [Planctomycetota bacterium]|nr:efflux RND transporter permease subunit [Planctomycetota bacterium]
MLLSDLALRRSVLAWALNLALLALGLWSLRQLPVRQYPAIETPVVSVRTDYPGAAAAVVENEVTRRLEEVLAGMPAVQRLDALSLDGSSRIDVEFAPGYDLEAAASEVRDRVARVRRQLPDDADAPAVEKSGASSAPMMWIAMRSDERDAMQLSDLARREIVDALATVPGVASVRISGERRPALRVWLDLDRLAVHGLTPAMVEAAIRAAHAELPAGRIEGPTREFVVRADARLDTPERFAALPLRADPLAPLRLGDVARIEIAPANLRSALLIDGRDAVGIGIVRQTQADTLAVADAVRARLARLRARLPPDIRLTVAYDESAFISASLAAVASSLAEAALCVALVMLAFLGSLRAALVPLAAVPISLIAAFPALLALGCSVNVLTLLALVLAIGLVVDDAIVVLENAERRQRLGEPPALAAARGARQVAFAVIATTVVLVACLVPLALQTSRIGRLFGEFAIGLAAAVVASSFVALTLTPVLCRSLLSTAPHPSWLQAAHERLHRGYLALLDAALARRWLALAIVPLAAIACVALYGQVRRELAPVEDMGRTIALLELPQGATLQETRAVLAEANALAMRYAGADGPVDHVLALIPGPAGGSGVNTAFLGLRFKPWNERRIAQQDMTAELNAELRRLPGAQAFARNPESFGIRDFGQALQAVVCADDHATARALAETLMARLRDAGFSHVRSDADVARPALIIDIDREACSRLGVEPRAVAAALTAFAERRIATRDDQGLEQDIILQVAPEQRALPSDLERLPVAAADGRIVPLLAVASWRSSGLPRDLRRIDRRAAVVVQAQPPPELDLGAAIQRVEDLAAALPEPPVLTWSGAAREYLAAGSGQALLYGGALLVVYLALAALFESWLLPLLVLLTVPTAVAGALAALALTGQGNHIYSQIGMVMLVGLAAKNGILLLDVAHRARDRGLDARAAARLAASLRLRPVLMTSVAMIAGAIPLVLHGGAGSEARAAIATVIIGGLGLSTVLTLVVLPVLYAACAGRFHAPGAATAALTRLEREIPDADHAAI